MKIAIGLPTNRSVKPKMMESLLKMVTHSKYNYHFIISNKGYTTAENRNYIMAQALKNNCSHILLTDDDMIFEQDSLDRLLAHKKHIVGGTYNVRRTPEEVGNVDRKVIDYFRDEEGSPITKDDEIFKCKALGGGLLLIDLSIIPKMKTPLFWYEVHEVGMITMSNDWWFCREARRVGYNVWCDPTLKIKHIGDYEY